MVRQRVFGSDVDFMNWLRSHDELFPSSNAHDAYVATDVDFFWHQYMTKVDVQGTRDIQAMMMIEVKTRGGNPTAAQLDTLFKIHIAMTAKRSLKVRNRVVRNLGVAILKLSGTCPDDSDNLWWGRFNADGELKWQVITFKQLVQLLQFALHPDNLNNKTPFRRHHKVGYYIAKERTPLGFEIDKVVTVRS